MNIKLSPRLLAAAYCIPVGSRVIDVGTDHAKLPVWLVQNHIAEHVWAGDIRPGPLQGAEKLISAEGLTAQISLRLTNGLHGFSEADCDTISVCGMGGENIVKILSEAPWINQNKLLVLIPHTKPECLRRWLNENSFAILSEQLVKDNNRIYPVLTAKSGSAANCAEIEYYTGSLSLIRNDSLFPEYISILKRKLTASAPFDEHSSAMLNALYKIKEDIQL